MTKLREARALLQEKGVTFGVWHQKDEDGSQSYPDAGCYCAVGALRKIHSGNASPTTTVGADWHADVKALFSALPEDQRGIGSYYSTMYMEDMVIQWNDRQFTKDQRGIVAAQQLTAEEFAVAGVAVLELFDRAIEASNEA